MKMICLKSIVLFVVLMISVNIHALEINYVNSRGNNLQVTIDRDGTSPFMIVKNRRGRVLHNQELDGMVTEMVAKQVSDKLYIFALGKQARGGVSRQHVYMMTIDDINRREILRSGWVDTRGELSRLEGFKRISGEPSLIGFDNEKKWAYKISSNRWVLMSEGQANDFPRKRVDFTNSRGRTFKVILGASNGTPFMIVRNNSGRLIHQESIGGFVTDVRAKQIQEKLYIFALGKKALGPVSRQHVYMMVVDDITRGQISRGGWLDTTGELSRLGRFKRVSGEPSLIGFDGNKKWAYKILSRVWVRR